MQLAAVIGTYGLSLLVIMISSAPALALRQKDKIGLWSSLGLIIAGSLLIGGYGVSGYTGSAALRTATSKSALFSRPFPKP